MPPFPTQLPSPPALSSITPAALLIPTDHTRRRTRLVSDRIRRRLAPVAARSFRELPILVALVVLLVRPHAAFDERVDESHGESSDGSLLIGVFGVSDWRWRFGGFD